MILPLITNAYKNILTPKFFKLYSKECFIFSVACSVGTFYDITSNNCLSCPGGTYQDKEGQLTCLPCLYQEEGVGVNGAASESQCEGLYIYLQTYSLLDKSYSIICSILKRPCCAVLHIHNVEMTSLHEAVIYLMQFSGRQ